jgi:DNA repair exonuclease SbcCD ATPase subunit
MRALCLKLKGFTSFKAETTVDLAGLDRFAICGPTGAGKSSLLEEAAEQTSRASAYGTARAELDRAAAEADVLPALRERRDGLAEAVDKVALRDQFARPLAAHQERHQGLVEGHSRRAAEAETQAEETAALAGALERAEADLAAVEYDEKRHRHLDVVRESAVRLQGERKHAAGVQ